MRCKQQFFIFFFLNDPATPEIYTLSLHDPLPIFDAPVLETRYLFHRLEWTAAQQPHIDLLHPARRFWKEDDCSLVVLEQQILGAWREDDVRSEEHTSEPQSQSNLACRLLLEKKKIPVLMDTTQQSLGRSSRAKRHNLIARARNSISAIRYRMRRQ